MFSLKTFTKPQFELELLDGTKKVYDPLELMTQIDDKFTAKGCLVFEGEGQKIVIEVMGLPADTGASSLIAIYSEIKKLVTGLDYVKNILTPPQS